MDLIFRCPECGDEVTSEAGWKQWCPKHETTKTVTDDGVLMRRRIVEMEPVNA